MLCDAERGVVDSGERPMWVSGVPAAQQRLSVSIELLRFALCSSDVKRILETPVY